MSKTEIRVNVYDLTKLNSLFRSSMTGIYHTSVVVGNEFEIYYGFLRYGSTGVDYAEEINILPQGMSGTLYNSYVLGFSIYSVAKCQKKARQMSLREEWLSDRYNILEHNCHSFSFAFCSELLRPFQMSEFPMYVFQAEKIGSKMYTKFFNVFINEDKPPFFLNKKKPDRAPPKIVKPVSKRANTRLSLV